MTKKALKEILETLANKIALENIYKREGRYEKNFRECPFHSEAYGMTETLKILGIRVDYEYDEEVKYIKAISANGIRVEIA